MTKSDKQALISAARRRAKAAARADGQSHQSHLEQIAREAGRKNWSAFLKSPAELSTKPASQTIAQEPTLEEKWDAAWEKVRVKWNIVQIVPGLILFIFVLMMAMPELWIPELMDSESSFPIQAPEDFGEYLGIATIVLLMIMSFPAIEAITVAGGATITSMKKTLPASILRKAWIIAIGRFLPPLGTALGLIFILPNLVPSIPTDDAISMQEDQRLMMPIAFANLSEKKGAVVTAIDGSKRTIAALIIDARSIPSKLRTTNFIAEEDIRNSYRDHPVIRLTASLDCETGEYRLIGIETAKTLLAPTHITKPSTSQEIFSLSSSDYETLCSADIAR